MRRAYTAFLWTGYARPLAFSELSSLRRRPGFARPPAYSELSSLRRRPG